MANNYKDPPSVMTIPPRHIAYKETALTEQTPQDATGKDGPKT